MDFAEMFDPPHKEMVGKREVTFPIIPVMVLGEKVAQKAKDAKKQRAKKLVEDNALSGQEKLIVLRDGDLFYIEDIHDFVNTLEGAVLACRVSLEVASTPPAEIEKTIGAMKPYQLTRVALVTTGFASLVDAAPKKEQAEENPLPEKAQV